MLELIAILLIPLLLLLLLSSFLYSQLPSCRGRSEPFDISHGLVILSLFFLFFFFGLALLSLPFAVFVFVLAARATWMVGFRNTCAAFDLGDSFVRIYNFR